MRSARCTPRSARSRRWCCCRAMRRHGNSAAAASRKSARPTWRRPSARHLDRDIRGDARPRYRRGDPHRHVRPPGPVHLSLPSDLLEERVESNAIVWPDRRRTAVTAPTLAGAVADSVLAAIAAAERPIIFAGPQLSNVSGRALLNRLEPATRTPAVILESPRGIADATLGALRTSCVASISSCCSARRSTSRRAGHRARLSIRACASLRSTPRRHWSSAPQTRMGERLLLGCIADIRTAAETLIARAAMARTRRPLADRGARCARPSARRVGECRCKERRPIAPG